MAHFLSLFLFFASALLVDPITFEVEMQDGKKLPTDIYFCKDPDAPCVLIRSPSGKRSPFATVYLPLLEHGYNIAIQDTRSAIDSEGKTLPYLDDGWHGHTDGHDTIRWLSRSPYSNGKIGMIGTSAMGITQILAAPYAPETLKCQYIRFAAASLYHDCLYNAGSLLKHQVEAWLSYYAPHPSVYKRVLKDYTYAPWVHIDAPNKASKVKVPALHYGGWYDTFLKGTLTSFVSLQQKGGVGAKGNQKLIIGPWTHFWPTTDVLGDYKVPSTGIEPPFDISPVAWFDHHLKGKELDLPTVTYYVMGPFDEPTTGHFWKTASTWPPAYEPVAYYFKNDGTLATAEEGTKTCKNYLYNPEKPCPTIGGNNLFLDSGPKDQRPIEQRPDVIVYSTEVFEQDTEFTGPVKAKIYFSSNQDDTDLVVKLTDVYPDGKSLLITEGITRKGANASTMPLEVDLWATSLVVAKGHRLRALITSSNYPRYEKNRNILPGKSAGVISNKALNTIWHGGSTASMLILPKAVP